MASEVKLYPFWGKDKPSASSVWEHFGFQRNRENEELNKKTTYCKYCLRSFVYNGTTSSLISHLNRCHPSITLTLRETNYPGKRSKSGQNQEDSEYTYFPLPTKARKSIDNEDDSQNTEGDNNVQRNEDPDGNMHSSEGMKIYSFQGKQKSRQSGGSVAWEYFGFKMDAYGELDKSKTYCRLCLKGLSYCGGTTNMISHLLRVHPETDLKGFSINKEFIKRQSDLKRIKRHRKSKPVIKMMDKFESDVQNPLAVLVQSEDHIGSGHTDGTSASSSRKESTSTTNRSGFVSSAKSREKQKNVSLSISRFLAEDMFSVEILNGAGFKNMMSTLDPGYKINTAKFYQDKMEETYNSEKNQMENEIMDTSCGALTIELWSIPSKDSNYITVGYNFVSVSWKHSDIVLKTMNIPNNQDSVIADAIQSVLATWNLSDTLLYAVAGNNPNIRGALNEIEKDSIACFGDVINHAVISAMSRCQISNTIHTVRETCRNFSAHPEATLLLKGLCHENFPDVTFPATMPSAEVGSWTEVYQMLVEFQKFEKPLKLVLEESAVVVEDFEVISDSEWSTLSDIVHVISPLHQVTESLCTEGNPTASSILPIMHQLQTLTKPQPSDPEEIKNIKQCILDVLDNAYQDENTRDILLLSTVIDPRFKTLWFLSDNEKFRVYKNLNLAAIDAVHLKNDGSDDEEPPNKMIKLENDAETGANEPPKGLASLFGLNVITEPESDKVSHHAPEKEVLQYREEKQLAMDGDPFAWWRDREIVFPILSQLARRYLCVPACSLKPGLLFTHAGEAFRNKRLTIASDASSTDQIDQQLMLFHNLNQ